MIPIMFREAFCEDFKIPIKIFDSPLFEYYLDLYEHDMKISEKVRLFNSCLSDYQTIDKFKDEWHRIKKQIVAGISATAALKNLVADNSGYQSPYRVERGNPYTHAFKGVDCISIDLISANYNCLRNHDASIVLGTKNFQELVAMYSGNPYYANVKIFRQVVFEQLSPTRQQSLQRKMMDSVLAELYAVKNDMYLRMPSNDEIVIPLWKDQSTLREKIKEVTSSHALSPILRIEEFTVEHIFDDLFFKKFTDGRIQLRKVPSQHYPRAFKMAKGLPVTDNDLHFVFEGRRAKFSE
jgi:hypothetical protein